MTNRLQTVHLSDEHFAVTKRWSLRAIGGFPGDEKRRCRARFLETIFFTFPLGGDSSSHVEKEHLRGPDALRQTFGSDRGQDMTYTAQQWRVHIDETIDEARARIINYAGEYTLSLLRESMQLFDDEYQSSIATTRSTKKKKKRNKPPSPITEGIRAEAAKGCVREKARSLQMTG
jgi:hypothetical protein